MLQRGSAYSLPDFSWDTLPVAWHSALSGDWSPQDLKNIAKYPIITLEKTAGSKVFNWSRDELLWGVPTHCQKDEDLSACGCCEEDNMIHQAKAVKAANPRVQVIVYMNSVIAYPWYRSAHKHVTNRSWWLQDINGTYLSNIAQDDRMTWHTWDFSKPEVGDLWIEACRNMTDSGYIDGCFMDGCANWDPFGKVDGRLVVPGPLEATKRKVFATNKPAWMKRLQAQIPGVAICGSGGGWVEGTVATQVQNWGANGDYAEKWIPMLQRAAAAGVLFEAHSQCGKDPQDPDEQTKIAAFLIAAGRHSYYMCGGWGAGSVDWYAEYDLPLGEPLSNATLDADGIYRRNFSKGTAVMFNTKTNTGIVSWAGSVPVVSAECPASHPWAYRPAQNFDYCCASADDKFGHVGINSLADRSGRASSCKGDAYVRCAQAPCDDFAESSISV